MTTTEIQRQDKGPVAYLTLNRPESYNALSLELMREFLDHLAMLDRDTTIRAVVLKGAGRGFCAGHDLKQIQANPAPAFRKETFETCARLMLAITGLRQPVIAMVHGIATAAGCQLVATCDLALASMTAHFGTPGVNIGLFCSTPMVALSRAIHRKQAMEMLLTGDLISAEAAMKAGLINRTVADDSLRAETEKLALKIAMKSALVLKTGKEAFFRQAELPLADAYEYCTKIMVENMEFQDAEEGIGAFLEKRPPLWQDA